MKIYDVIIIGGGPTGIALGIELGLHNISTLILEKYPAPLLSPRAQYINARSMEFFMRWGLDDELKASQISSEEFPNQAVWCSKLNGNTYAVSSSNDQLNDDLSPQRSVRLPLWVTEGILRDKLQTFPSVSFLKEYEVINIGLEQDHLIISAKNNSQTINYKATYVVACDGANSITRRQAGIDFKNLTPAKRVISVVFETTDLKKHISVTKGCLFYLLESPISSAIGSINPSHGLWYAQIIYDGDAETIDEIDIDQLMNELTGCTFSKKIINTHFWDMHIQLAEKFSYENRIFLVGDSAHAFVPAGAFGLNTGFGDVVNLGWKLAAVIKKQAQPNLLETYEMERLPVCLRNLEAAQQNADDMTALRKKYNPRDNLEEFAKANIILAKQFTRTLGLTMGYAYFNSPLTHLFDGQSIAPMLKITYQPIAAPGYFLPHIWVSNKQSIYSVLSAINWTLIVSADNCADLIQAWQNKFNQNLSNLKILILEKNSYSCKYILVRPDWHIAYISDELDESYFELCLSNFTK